MGKKEEEEVKRLREAYDRVKSKKENRGFNFSIPHAIRTPLIWTLFFAIIGIIQRSIIDGKFAFVDFFYKYYLEWFASFANFSDNYAVANAQELITILAKDWYYFFLTGGIISLIWAIIYVLVNVKFERKRDDFNLYVDNKLSKSS